MNRYSKIAVMVVLAILILIRIYYSKPNSTTITHVLTWDALGYYLILPAHFIYHDVKRMNWVEEIVHKYQNTGSLYQLAEKPNGNRVMKYLLGISIMYSPFFILGHSFAGWLDYPQDGFSAPYQLSISLAAIFYAFLGLLVLRHILLQFYSDRVTALTLILVALATNYAQYVSVDSGQTHGFIFTQYAVLLYLTVSWHNRPTHLKAFLIGALIGLGVISRPTEGVMLFIPLLYGTHNIIAKREKWSLVGLHKSHIASTVIGAFIGILPQLLYWKTVTGNWVYDVGSKWTFLQPNWQVLFGWEKGWFIYTPIVLLMVLGLFYFRKNPFYWSAVVYFILNTWIIIAWDDWHYGASYSSRALVQSYALMSLPLAAMIQKIQHHRWRIALYVIMAYLTVVNLFQLWQYNKTILHYNAMNRRYYQAIYLNSRPSPAQMSLLDTKEYIRNDNPYRIANEIKIDSQFLVNASQTPEIKLFQAALSQIVAIKKDEECWLKISLKELSSWGAFDSHVIAKIGDGNDSKVTKIRMQNGISQSESWNELEFYFKIPAEMKKGQFSLFAETKTNQNIFIKDVAIKVLTK